MIPFVIIIASGFANQINQAQKFLLNLIQDKGLLLALKKDFPFQHPDIVLFTGKPSVGIEEVRGLKKILSRRPYQARERLVLIPEAERLTLEAQNALLKTLEEPPKDTFIVLTVDNQNALLPTILSRAQVINKKRPVKLLKNKKRELACLVRKIVKASPGERILLAEKYSETREEAKIFCQDLLLFWHQLLISPGKKLNLSPQTINQALKKTQKAKLLIKKNVNVRLALENLFLNLLPMFLENTTPEVITP